MMTAAARKLIARRVFEALDATGSYHPHPADGRPARWLRQAIRSEAEAAGLASDGDDLDEIAGRVHDLCTLRIEEIEAARGPALAP